MKYLTIAALFLLILVGCKKEKSQAEKDDEIINNYLVEHNIDAVKHSSGLYYHIIEEGSGDNPSISSTVEVKYKGYLANGDVFDETTGDNTIKFPLSNLITGWQYGIPLLKKGGEGIFFLPSILGYGSRSAGSIPPNSVLIFEIELIDFE